MLKAKIKKLEDVAEPLRGFYKQEGDEFVLQTEGMVPKEKLDEFRTNNIALQQQMDKLKDIDPAKYRELVELDREVKAGELIKAGKLEEAVNLRVGSMKADLEGKLSEKETALDRANRQLSSLLIDNAVKSTALRSGVLPSAVDDVVARARGIYVVEDGKVVPKENGQVVFGKDGKTPKPIDEWAAELKTSAPHLFAGSQGSGAGGGRNIGGRDMSTMSSTDKISAGLAAGGLLGRMPGE